MDKLDILGKGDVLVLAGSIPGSMPDDIYERILGRLSGRGVMAVVDAAGELLVKVLKYRPFLIKPNIHELGEIFGAAPKTREQALPYALKLAEMGAVNVLVSMGGEGAFLAAADGRVYGALAPEGRLVNAVGAGDSMVAGFLAGYLENGDYGHALRLAGWRGRIMNMHSAWDFPQGAPVRFLSCWPRGMRFGRCMRAWVRKGQNASSDSGFGEKEAFAQRRDYYEHQEKNNRLLQRDQYGSSLAALYEAEEGKKQALAGYCYFPHEQMCFQARRIHWP